MEGDIHNPWCYYSNETCRGFGRIEQEWQNSCMVQIHGEQYKEFEKKYLERFPTLKEAVQCYINRIPKDLIKKDGLELTVWAIAERRFRKELPTLNAH